MPQPPKLLGFFSVRRARLALLVPAVMLLLQGCWPFQQSAGGPSAATRAATPVAQATHVDGARTSPVADVTPLPRTEDALNIAGQRDDPPTLDPALATDGYSLFIVRQLFNGLVTYDENLNVVPDIAAALPSVSPDGKTYTFALRKGVRFTDGQEVTAADFKFSMERAANPELAGPQDPSTLPAAVYLGDIVGVKDKIAGKAQAIEGVQAPDPYTLVITIDAPKAYFLSKLTASSAFVVQSANVKEGQGWTEHPRGTGPFKLEKWVHKQQMVLVRNPQYYAGAPDLSAVNIWMGANALGAVQQYETGGLDVADVPVDDIERMSDRNNPVSKELRVIPDLSVTYLGFNIRQKPFDDPKVREAFSLAIDRQKIARVMFQSRVTRADGIVPPNLAGYKAELSAETYNVSEARRLMSESTYKDARNLPRVRLYTSGDSLGPMLSEVLSQTLGVDMEVHEVEWSDFLEGLDRRDYGMFTLEWGADYPDPESFLGTLFRSDSAENHFGYQNPSIDEALNAAAVERDQQKRMTTYAQIEQRILQDNPMVPLFHSVRYVLVKPYVKNLKITPMGILSLRDVRLVSR